MENLIFLVRSQLVARLGIAVASWFRIVPSRCEADHTPVFALLLDGHLPILVRLAHTGDAPLGFSVGDYDAQGGRLDAGRTVRAPQTFEFFAVVVADAGNGFQQLKEQAHASPGHQPHHPSAGQLPEEAWLHDALHHPGAIPTMSVGISGELAEQHA